MRERACEGVVLLLNSALKETAYPDMFVLTTGLSQGTQLVQLGISFMFMHGLARDFTYLGLNHEVTVLWKRPLL